MDNYSVVQSVVKKVDRMVVGRDETTAELLVALTVDLKVCLTVV